MPLAHKRILLVEDEYFIARDMMRVFRSLGAVVIGPISRAEAALEIVKDEDLDAAVLDVGLRGDGTVFPVADALAAKNVPFIFSSGCSPDILPERHRNAPWFEKPVKPEQIARALARFPTKENGERISYSIWAEGALWHWVLKRNGSVVVRGNARSKIGARSAAMSANPDG